jgi:hypothetical protein
MENFILFTDFKLYGNSRMKIRFDGFGYINTRIHIISFKKLKGFRKQLNHFKEIGATIDVELYSLISKEIEFREMCLSMRSIFDIKIK